MSGLKNLASDTVWYGLSSIVARFISWLLVPLYTAVFATGEYGIVTELYAYVAFFYVLYTYGMETAYFRFAKEPGAEGNVFNLSMSALLTTSVAFSAILVLFSTDMVNVLGYEGKEEAVYYLAAIIAIDAMAVIPYARLRFQNKARRFALIKFGQILLTVLLNVFFLVLCYNIYQGIWFPDFKEVVSGFFDAGFKVKYVFISNLIANGATFIFLLTSFSNFGFKLSLKELKPILAYAYPLLFLGLAAVTNEMLSRTLLTSWLPDNFYPGQTSKEALGVFGACYKLSMLMVLGNQAFRYAAEPFFFSKADEEGSPKLFAKIMSGFVGFNALVFVAVSVNLEPISVLFLTNPEYRAGLGIVPFLLLGYLFSGIYYNLSVWYKLTDRTQFGAIITGIGALLTILANYFLIPVLGYFGSSLATLITFFSMATLSYLLGQKHYPIPYKTSRILEYIGVASIIVFVFYQLDTGGFWLNIIVRNGAVLTFILYIYLRERKNLSGVRIYGFRIP